MLHLSDKLRDATTSRLPDLPTRTLNILGRAAEVLAEDVNLADTWAQVLSEAIANHDDGLAEQRSNAGPDQTEADDPF